MKYLPVFAVLIYLSGSPAYGQKEPPAEKIAGWRKDAEQGDANAQYYLGLCFNEGWGMVKDDAQAAKWYRKAAEQGYADAQFNLGGCYANGEGVVKDDAEAVKWWRKAAEQGYAKAQLFLGAYYANGTGVKKDEAEAVKWCRPQYRFSPLPSLQRRGNSYQSRCDANGSHKGDLLNLESAVL